MKDRPPKPADHYTICPYGVSSVRWIVQRKTYEWWRRRGTWLEKTADSMVDARVYDEREEAQAVADRLNGEMG